MDPVDGAARLKAVQRLTWLAGGVLLWGALIFWKLISLQVLHHQTYVERAHRQQEQKIELPAPRGTITDRNGEVLAMSVPADSVHINPLRLPDVRTAAAILAPILSLNETALERDIQAHRTDGKGFMWVKHKISAAESERLRAMHLEWIEYTQESRRIYPNGPVAAHVIGSVYKEEEGSDGIEKHQDSLLKGHPGAARLLTDVKRRGIELVVEQAPQTGKPLQLTIDSRIQFIAERELAKAAEMHHATTGAAIVMNPKNGEILALANWPSFDPNEPPVTKEQKLAHRNLGFSVPFEPGSIFKTVTLAAAIETTSLRPESLINCHNGFLKLPGRVVHEAHGGFGTLTMAQVLEKSSNIGAIEIGSRVGQEMMYDYVRRFGFGSKTGLPLPAESAGLLRKLNHWGKTSLASISMGQEVSTTSVQLARACSVIANGGLLVTPKLVVAAGGTTAPDATPKRVLKPATAATMRQMMEGVVLRGTAKGKANLDGYTSAGKTGTAQIFDVPHHVYTKTYNASFMGFAPVNNPALVIVVTLNGTTGSAGYGGSASAPAFKAIATEALRILDIPKDLPEDLPVVQTKNGKSATPEQFDDLAQVEIADGSRNILEDDETAQPAAVPAAPAPASNPVTASLIPTPPAPRPEGPMVPDLRGKTLPVALQEAMALGLDLRPEGRGLVRAQLPEPGAALRPGETIRVRLAR